MSAVVWHKERREREERKERERERERENEKEDTCKTPSCANEYKDGPFCGEVEEEFGT